jgi:hypothetical protein
MMFPQAAQSNGPGTGVGPAAMRGLASFVADCAAGGLDPALQVASEACHAAPDQPQPYCPHGESWSCLPNQGLVAAQSDRMSDFEGSLVGPPADPDPPFNPNCTRFREDQGRMRVISNAQVCQPVNAAAYLPQRAPLTDEPEPAASQPPIPKLPF